MGQDNDKYEAPTRRDYVTYLSAIGASGLLAGCTGDSEAESTPASTATESSTGDSTEPATDETTADDGSYSVTMAPMGEVTFDSVPESIFTRLTHHAGMVFALGRGNDVNAMHAPDYYDALWNQFTPRLPGVELDWTGLYSSWQPSKEKLYELDSDVHIADPAGVSATSGWEMRETEEIGTTIAPWFGNYYSDTHAEPPTEWADRYEYYTLWEMFEKVAAVFREGERYQALAAIHTDLLGTIESGLPSRSERPTAVMAGLTEIESPWVYKTNVPGFLAAHVRPLGARDAFEDELSSGSQVDMEAMLEADPDVIFALGGLHPDTDIEAIRRELEAHSVGQQLTAVKNDRIYAQGARYQGPILNLFQLEMTAKQLYPEAFGGWSTYTEGPYPEIPAEEQLFDRQRVADIINGDS